MKTLIRAILSLVIGVVVAVLLLLILSENLYVLVTAGVAAFVCCGFAYGLSEGTGMKTVITVAAFIVAFLLYLWLASSMMDWEYDGYIVPMIVFCIPYVALTFVVTAAYDADNQT